VVNLREERGDLIPWLTSEKREETSSRVNLRKEKRPHPGVNLREEEKRHKDGLLGPRRRREETRRRGILSG